MTEPTKHEDRTLPPNWRPPDLDLGDGHFLWWTDPPDQPREDPNLYTGAWIDHASLKPNEWNNHCLGHITLGDPVNGWQLHCFPATITPSIACGCGDHGFVRNGKWVRA